MVKREFNMGSSEENFEQRNEREILRGKIERLIEETPQTPETIAILSVLNTLMGAITTHAENTLSDLTTKFANEEKDKILRKRN